MSGTVLDQVHIEEILGVDVARSVGHARSLAKSPQAALDSLPNSCMEAIDQLCVRAESAAVLGRALTVAVIGTQRSAGSTTLAMAMAGRYANSGLSVVVIDGDPKQPDVSTTFDTSQTTGVHGLLALVAAEPREGEPGWWQRRGLPIFAASSVADVRILGIGTEGVLRRDEVPRLLSAAGTAGQVVIIDCGPLLEAASTVEFARQVDAIVLAVPQRIQRVGTLEVVARQLAERRGELLPVLTSPSRRRRSARAQQRFAKAKAKANAKARSKSAATAIVDDSLQPDPLAADELASVLEPVRTHRWSRDIDDRGVGTGRVPPRPMTSMTSSTEDRDPPPADDDNALDDDPAATFAQRETARRLRPKSAR
jgi:Mrp family chromosome partitioning ATPase